jgi:phage terminase Nu1 subunit (DNA packaging protein)
LLFDGGRRGRRQSHQQQQRRLEKKKEKTKAPHLWMVVWVRVSEEISRIADSVPVFLGRRLSSRFFARASDEHGAQHFDE